MTMLRSRTTRTLMLACLGCFQAVGYLYWKSRSVPGGPGERERKSRRRALSDSAVRRATEGNPGRASGCFRKGLTVLFSLMVCLLLAGGAFAQSQGGSAPARTDHGLKGKPEPAAADSRTDGWKKSASRASQTRKPAVSASDARTRKLDRALFAAGCFWKVQYIFSKVPGVVKTTVGYSGGTTKKPTYEQVCSHSTGHAETVLVEYDPSKTTYKKLLEVFWSNHDPTTLNRQGPDVGTQYRSVVFYTDADQKRQALELKADLEKSRRFVRPMVTAIEPAGTFYPAEEYHQDYYIKHGAACF